MTVIQMLEVPGGLIEAAVKDCGDHVAFSLHFKRVDIEESPHQFIGNPTAPADPDVVRVDLELDAVLLAELQSMLKGVKADMRIKTRESATGTIAEAMVESILRANPDAKRGPDLDDDPIQNAVNTVESGGDPTFVDLGFGLSGVPIDNRWPDDKKIASLKLIADPAARREMAERLNLDPALVADEPDLQA